jgi:hypothetical protein
MLLELTANECALMLLELTANECALMLLELMVNECALITERMVNGSVHSYQNSRRMSVH